MDVNWFYERYLSIERPYEHQTKLWCLLGRGKYPVLVKAPTGSGKTEAVVAPFLRQFIANDFSLAPRLIYVLPMRVLVNSVADRVRQYASRIDSTISVEVQHGDLPNSPFFLPHIVITTLDQFVYGFARASNQVGRHLDVPAGAIASSLVIFDEAHMYRDGFTFSIMRALMEILHRSKIPFVAMTATMPTGLEESLFENIAADNECRVFSDVGVSGRITCSHRDDPLYKDNEVSIPHDLVNRIKKEKTLVVLNQVERAKRVYDYLRKTLDVPEDGIVLLHSRFTTSDRERHESKALEVLKHRKGGVVVSTQVLEVGMDFSASLLLTELAPADALIQRAGRCARYGGEQGEMVIFPAENRYPYEEKHIRETCEWLRSNPGFDIRNFAVTCSFVDVLDYRADDFAARDSLIDLYEAVLYADSKPQNIQVREGKSCYLLVVNLAAGEGRKHEDRILSAIKKADFRGQLLGVDTRIAWDLRERGDLRWGLRFDQEGQPSVTEVNQVTPFGIYILDSSSYDEDFGVKKDEAPFI